MTSPDFQIPRSVVAMLKDGPTAPLSDFIKAFAIDDNWWWRISCGHHQNLFESALDQLDTLLEGAITQVQLVDEFNDAAESIEMEAAAVAKRRPTYAEGMRAAATHMRELARSVEARNAETR